MLKNFGSSRMTAVLILALLLLAGMSGMMLAQTTVATGSIVGVVTDPTGAVVSGVTVTVTDKATNQSITLKTNSAGQYASGALVPGTYAVRVEASGFKATRLTLAVLVDNTSNGNVKLEVGQASETVEVSTSSVQVNTEQAEVQGVLNSDQIANLPVNGRNFLDLAQLEPGVQIQDGANFDPTKVGYSSISFGGRFGRTARIDVDGVDVSDETVGTTTEDIPASSIQEFSLAQSTLDLSNDLTSSGAVNVTTKSGTNSFHGEAFGTFRDSSVGAALLPSPPNPASPSYDVTTGLGPGIPTPYQRNQEGGNFGGPVIKDKLFFFADGERTLQHLAAPVAEVAPLSSESGTFAAPFKELELMARVDYALTKTARMFGRFNYFDNNTDATFFPSSFQVYDNKNYTRNDVFGLDFNTGSFTHSIRFSYLKFQNQIVDATRGSNLPFANFPVSINIGSFTVGPNLLAPQSTPQSDHQVKYDGSKILGKHILRFGFAFNHIQGGGFASFFKIDPQSYGLPGSYCTTVSSICPAGPDGTPASNPLDYNDVETIVGNGQGFSTTSPALGFPAGGLGPDNRTALYIGDTWKILHNLTISPGLRWERDTGRTDSDLGAIAPLNAAFPGWGNPIPNPNKNFAPQLGIAWDPKGDGKTVIRAGSGLYYENVIYNNVLFDRPYRLASGAFLSYPLASLGGSAQPVTIPTGTITVDQIEGLDPVTSQSYCADTIGQGASALAAFETYYQGQVPFSLTAPNPGYIGAALSSGLNVGAAMFAPDYRSPRALQMNLGIQHEIRKGMVFSADYLRNVETHFLLGIDVNQTGAARNFAIYNTPAQLSAGTAPAQEAIAATVAACNSSQPGLQGAINSCPGLNQGNAAVGATISNFAANGLGSAIDTGSALACPAGGCAFGGVFNGQANPLYGQMQFLEPVGRSVYNALQMKWVENVENPLRGIKYANFQVSYSLSRFVNPNGWQGNYAPSNPVASSDQDFVLQATDNDHPLRYMGPSLLDRTHQISFGGNLDVPYGFRFGVISHFYSPLSSPMIIGDNGSLGQIFQTDFTGSGSYSDPMPGTKNGSYMRTINPDHLNAVINNYNNTIAGTATPAGQQLINAGLFSLAQLQQIGAVAPALSPAPANFLTFPWLRAFDFRVSWKYTFAERVTIEPNVGFYNVFNFSNFNLPPGAMTGWLNEGAGSINSIVKNSPSAIPFRVGAGTGVFGLGAPRTTEWGMRLTF